MYLTSEDEGRDPRTGTTRYAIWRTSRPVPHGLEPWRVRGARRLATCHDPESLAVTMAALAAWQEMRPRERSARLDALASRMAVVDAHPLAETP